MLKIWLDISGPGETHTELAEVVRKALADAGATVLVYDQHHRELKKEPHDLRDFEVMLTVKHYPWGG